MRTLVVDGTPYRVRRRDTLSITLIPMHTENGRRLLLLDSKDLRAMLQHVGDNAKTLTTGYGNVSAASIGAIQRGLLALDSQGGDRFFGEPMLNIDDMITRTYKLEDINQGYQDMLDGNNIRGVVTFDESDW